SAVPDHFRFAVKMPKQITHVLKLNNANESLGHFLDEVEELGVKLGPILIQLPPKLEFKPELARGFFQEMRDRFSGMLVCEPRHPSWFEARADGLLTDFAIARVVADPAIVLKAHNPGAYLDPVYFRLHGSPRVYYSAYGREFLEEMAIKLDRTRAMGVDAWCIFDNTAEGAALANALELGEICERFGGCRLTKP
ncbi:MAG TPA: DUF72 domain-containing protein, partial [Lacipirellulaceae bacterium]|nr:DUF72 domain-containing protein [Lacipirellulaceae bacterium]